MECYGRIQNKTICIYNKTVCEFRTKSCEQVHSSIIITKRVHRIVLMVDMVVKG